MPAPRSSNPAPRGLVALVLLVHLGCQEDCSGLPNFSFPDCSAEIGRALLDDQFQKAEDLVDAAATPLVGKIRVGQVVLLGPLMRSEICTQAGAPSVTWTSTAPQVAAVESTGALSAKLTGLSEGEAAVFATVDGSRVEMHFFCCGSCVSQPPLPHCQKVPVPTVRVVP